MKVLFVILASYASAGIALVWLMRAYQTESGQKYLISEDPRRSKSDKDLYRAVSLNMGVSIALIFAVMYTFTDYLMYDHAVPWWRFALEIVAVILIYDFGYYFMHRFLLHEWKPLKPVHAVHHAARNPRAIDSLLLHPVETVMGLSLFFGTVALVGGVHMYSLAVLFTLYTALNILNHAGVNVPHFPMKTLGYLAVGHDKHHHSMRHGNYSSITPLPDIVFGTHE